MFQLQDVVEAGFSNPALAAEPARAANQSHDAVEIVEDRSHEADSNGLLRSVRSDEGEPPSSELQLTPAEVSRSGHGAASATELPNAADECTICLEEVSPTPSVGTCTCIHAAAANHAHCTAHLMP